MDLKCRICKKELSERDAYEYRGVISCEEHFDQVVELRDYERAQIIKEESQKTESLRGLDLSDSVIGKANRKLLKQKIEIASTESQRLKNYERPGKK